MRIARQIPLLLVVMSLGVASDAAAQSPRRLLLQGYGAYVPTSGSLALGDGLAAGGVVGVMPVPHLWLLGSASHAWHRGSDELPDWEYTAYYGMLGYSPVPLEMNGLMIFYVGAGSVRFDPQSSELSAEAYFAMSGGIKLVYDFNRHVAGTVDVGISVALADKDYTGGDVWTYPLGLGLALRF
jgi:hypothetical protein